MTKDQIQAEFDGFIEYPQGSDKRYVTTASTLFFAHHIAKMAVKREREECAKVCSAQVQIEKYGHAAHAALMCENAIRARGTQ